MHLAQSTADKGDETEKDRKNFSESTPDYRRGHGNQPFPPSHLPCDQTCQDTYLSPCYESVPSTQTPNITYHACLAALKPSDNINV